MQNIDVEAKKWWLRCNFFVNGYVENFDYIKTVDFWNFSNPAKFGIFPTWRNGRIWMEPELTQQTHTHTVTQRL